MLWFLLQSIWIDGVGLDRLGVLNEPSLADLGETLTQEIKSFYDTFR